MSGTFVEPERLLPRSGACDVLVVGGGIAGVAAAVAAARGGAQVMLIERLFVLGGLATAGNVTVFLPLCDGEGNQVIRGLGQELLELSVRDGYDQIPACWRDPQAPTAQRREHRFRVDFNPVTYALALERLVLEAGIRLLYDTRLCQVVAADGRILAAVIENKSGRTAIACRTAVDASGDADVCWLAGEKTVSLATNTRCGWHYFHDGQQVQRRPYTEEYSPAGAAVTGSGAYAGDDAASVTAQVTATRDAIRSQWEQLRDQYGARFMPVGIPAIATHRMTRRLVGEVELEESHDQVDFPDRVGLTGDWRRPGPVLQIPLRCLLARRSRNLIVAGRCISAASAWDITRAIPACAVTGQAAGVAAALACACTGGDLRSLDIDPLQRALTGQGVQL